jgi:hypothetical protein
MPSLSGPALSFGRTRDVIDHARNLADALSAKIRTSVQRGLRDAADEGIRLETKVQDKLGKQLLPVEQLVDHITTLVQDSIAGSLAQAVSTYEDYSNQQGVTSRSTGVDALTIPISESFVYKPVPSQPSPAAAVVLRAEPSPGTGIKPQEFGPLRGENNPGLNPPGPCPMIDQATWESWQKQSQAIADVCNKQGGLPGEQYTGNWWRCTEDCCVTGPAVVPDDNPAPPLAKYFDFAVDGFASCARKGFAWFLTQWNQHAIKCGGVAPIDCTKFPFDPSCPPDCKAHPEDPRCVVTPPTCPGPCVNLSCPPPVINVPPCPPLNLPSCIQIDLCDWDKFCDFIKKCLVQAKEDCALDNETAYTYKDCDGSYSEAQQTWLGSLYGAVGENETVDDVNQKAQQISAALTADNFGPLNPY